MHLEYQKMQYQMPKIALEMPKNGIKILKIQEILYVLSGI